VCRIEDVIIKHELGSSSKESQMKLCRGGKHNALICFQPIAGVLQRPPTLCDRRHHHSFVIAQSDREVLQRPSIKSTGRKGNVAIRSHCGRRKFKAFGKEIAFGNRFQCPKFRPHSAARVS
jgi:hypothetical protein